MDYVNNFNITGKFALLLIIFDPCGLQAKDGGLWSCFGACPSVYPPVCLFQVINSVWLLSSLYSDCERQHGSASHDALLPAATHKVIFGMFIIMEHCGYVIFVQQFDGWTQQVFVTGQYNLNIKYWYSINMDHNYELWGSRPIF